MVATTLTDCRPFLSDSDLSDGDLVLRICGAPRDGQMVRVKSAKCTIGSGPRCTLRLRARGVWPLHCLIVRGPRAAVVRRWAADTRLNHQSFADAALSPGDRLSIGPIELEVVSVGTGRTVLEQPPEACRRQAPCAAPAQDVCGPHAETDPHAELERQGMEEERQRLDELAASLQQRETALLAEAERLNVQQADLEGQRQAVGRQQQQWQAEQVEAQRRLDQQRNELDARRSELEARQNALAEERGQWDSQRDDSTLQTAAQTEQLNARLAEVQAERDAFGRQQQQWQAEQVEAQRRLDQQRNELDARRSELEARQNALAEERGQWDSQRDDSTLQTAAQTEQLNARLAEVQAERDAFGRQQQQWQAEQVEAQRRLDQQRNELDARRSELEARQNALAEERRQWEIERAESPRVTEQPLAPPEAVAEVEPLPLAEPQFEAPPEGAPVDLAEVFRRVGAKVELEQEPPAPNRSAARAERPADAARQPSAAAAKASAKPEGEEESIEDYMGRLMQRINPGATGSGPASYTPPRPESGRAGRGTPAITPQAEPPKPPAAEERGPVSLAPRTVAPEKLIDFSALRELANLSAQSAISRYSRQLLISSMNSKLTVAMVALTAGVALFGMWKGLGATPLTYYSALAALLVAIYWGMEYALLSGRLTISKSGHIDIDWNASPHGSRSEPPVEPAAEESPAAGVSPAIDNVPEPAGARASPASET